jgi:hypothetical protein
MLENIKHIKTNFKFEYKNKNKEFVPLVIEKQVILKRANYNYETFGGGLEYGGHGYGYGYEAYHLELKVKIDTLDVNYFDRIVFLNEAGNHLFELDNCPRIKEYLKINLINLPLLVLEDTKTIQFVH